MAQKFFKKSIEIADIIAFILPISQLNNTRSMYEFDLVYSEDLGVRTYTDRDLHCCFNIYTRPENGELNKKPVSKLKDVSIYRQDSNEYGDKDFDMPDDFQCIWQKEVKTLLDSNKSKSDSNNIRIEKLFTYNI